MHYSPMKLSACCLEPKWAQMVLITELHRLPIQYEINDFFESVKRTCVSSAGSVLLLHKADASKPKDYLRFGK